jgi:hypothetical protein
MLHTGQRIYHEWKFHQLGGNPPQNQDGIIDTCFEALLTIYYTFKT